ncbi:MAG: PH domain-containing protein [Cyanobacteria bacterium J06643_4]
MYFRSTVDPWFYSLVVSLPIVLVASLTPVLCGLPSTALVLAGVVLLPVMVLPTWLLFSTYYRVDSVILSIHSGPFTWTVPITNIHDVTPCRSIAAGPALSISRLRIEYGRQCSIEISPKHRTAFLEALGYYPAEIMQTSVSV